jgi:pimeloyl-ACP methyl ester carboxylesterase
MDADRRMTRIAACAAVAAWLVACGNASPPAAAPAAPAAAAAAASTPAPTVNDGSPRIVDSQPGVHIQYRVYGSGAPLVVLVHGWSCDSNYWAAQLADLKARYTVATVDLAGHGGSGANRDDWSMAAFGADVAAVVNELKDHPRVVLVGHSMGGPVVVEAARLLKSRVAGVIGVDTLGDVGLPLAPPAETQRLLVPFRKDFIGTTRQFVTRTFFTKNSDPLLVRRIADDMSQAPPAVAIPALEGMGAWDGATALADITAPLVLINSDLRPPADADRIRKLSPKFRLVTMTGVGHFLMMEDPKRFNPLLEQQIDSLL